MRTLCDVCESAAAILFCAADEAALCRYCDQKVHLCNKLASRHVRVGLSEPSGGQPCDICENAPAFFYCEVDGSSLCLQCDTVVHVGGKRTHARYLLFKQRLEFPGDMGEPGIQQPDPNEARKAQHQLLRITSSDNQKNHKVSMIDGNADVEVEMESKLIDLNSKPRRVHGQASTNQGMVVSCGNNQDSASIVPVSPFTRESEK